MDLNFLRDFVGMIWNIGHPYTETPEPIMRVFNQYARDNRTEILKGLGIGQQIIAENNPDKNQGLNMGLLIGVLLAHASMGFDGRRMLQEILDTNYQMKRMRLQSNVGPAKVSEPQVDVVKSVDEWLKKFNTKRGE